MVTKRVHIPSNEEFVDVVKKYFKRYPTVCVGSIENAGIIVSNLYRERRIDIHIQYDYFVNNIESIKATVNG